MTENYHISYKGKLVQNNTLENIIDTLAEEEQELEALVERVGRFCLPKQYQKSRMRCI